MAEPKLEWGRDLPGDLAEKWPKDENGDFVPAAWLTNCSQIDMGDAILTGVLDSCGIPFYKRFPHYGGFGNLMLGMSARAWTSSSPKPCWRKPKNILKGESEDEEL